MPGGDRHSADRHLALLLASGLTVRAASRKAGVSESTAFRRLRGRKFRALVDRLRGQLVTRTVGRLASLVRAAELAERGLVIAFLA